MKILIDKRTNSTSKMSSESYCLYDGTPCPGKGYSCETLKICPGPSSPGLMKPAPPLPPPPNR